jgi:hypothetical protein
MLDVVHGPWSVVKSQQRCFTTDHGQLTTDKTAQVVHVEF